MSVRKIELYVLGISTGSLRGGAYALILAEKDGLRRIPLVIGASEAQSIAIAMEGLVMPRPMTHDLFVSFAKAYGVRLEEVYVDHFENGIFSSQITFTDGERTVVMDARTSDAIAFAVREDAPIYTNEEILVQTGFVIEDDVITPAAEMTSAESTDGSGAECREQGHGYASPEDCGLDELRRRLDELIASENYEEAQRINAIIRKKESEGL